MAAETDLDKLLFPAHAGVIPIGVVGLLILCTFPRTRGGDPKKIAKRDTITGFSPHTRG